MNELTIFNFNNNQVQTVLIGNDLWFVGKEVATILGYSNPSTTISERVDSDEKMFVKESYLSNLRTVDNHAVLEGVVDRKVALVSESGMYSLIMGATIPTAKQFRRWVTHEVLPTIRKTGSYGIRAPQTLKEALQLALKQQEEMEVMKVENSVQKQQIAEMQPKASYYDWVLQTKDLVSVTIIAKQYGKSGQWLNDLLHKLKVQFKQASVWLLYQKYATYGYTKTNFAPDDAEHLHPHTKWTQKGMLFIYELLKSNGILPLIEQEEAA